ncbi:MAG: CDP-alcohol phosphatidyltransferase family protein [Actinomycetota bacterium]|jgi:CDP-diacylglycerol--glycerol-3-phosphate 3-phosphatidyltransferase|nr:CDP-alcohol phosphatidyltransferase family protein [Actinomycetota bacterium]
MFDGRWRETVDRGTAPAGRALRRLGCSADVLTGAGLVFAAATAVAIGSGHLVLGVVLLAVTGLQDLLDGPVAKAGGTASTRGAFFDSVADRVADALLFGGVAWYLAARRPGELVLLPVAVFAASALVSYERAKAESLGIRAKGGLMERAERIILLGIALLVSPILVPVLWVMLVLTTFTAGSRFVLVWRSAEAPVSVEEARRLRRERSVRRAERRRAASASARWRARRQGELSSRSSRAVRARRTHLGTRRRVTARRHG